MTDVFDQHLEFIMLEVNLFRHLTVPIAWSAAWLVSNRTQDWGEDRIWDFDYRKSLKVGAFDPATPWTLSDSSIIWAVPDQSCIVGRPTH